MTKILRTPNSKLRAFGRPFLIIWVALLLSCGYQFVGKETHVPSGLTSVAIPTFVNQTFEPGIEIPFTQGFLREFIRDRRVKVLDRSEADAILEGVVKTFQIYSVAYDTSGLATEYQTTIVVDLTLKKRNGETIWKEVDLSESRWYRMSFAVLVSESRRSAAIEDIGKVIAERVRNRYFYKF